MKKILILFFLCNNYVNGQVIIYEFCFDQLINCADYNMSDPEPILTIDVNSNPTNIWQIGSPQKQVLSNAWSTPKVIITDSINSYPNNDTSSFTIECTAIQSSSSVSWTNFTLNFQYFVDSDTLSDFGMIEFSPDNGVTWIDLINDPTYAQYLAWVTNNNVGQVPVLTGTSGAWIEANLNMRQLGIFLDIQPGTPFLWRFTFISDGIQNNRDGIMYDNILLEINPPIGIEQVNLNSNRKLVNVFDILGRETVIKSNTMLINLYNDGTSEKVFKVE
jgi:hypothetical protein